MEVAVRVPGDLVPDGRIVLRDDVLAVHAAALPAARATAPPQRLVYAAAHVVMRESYRTVAHSVASPGAAAVIAEHVDWGATMRIRRALDDQGFAIAEAMDTAQRFCLGWDGARRLIESCGAAAPAHGFVAGAGSDHLEDVPDVATLVDAVAYQAAVIRAAGGEVILLPMPQLPRWNAVAATYIDVYRAILDAIEGPVYIHWLGEMFMPELAGYFPDDSFLQVMRLDPAKVRGAKLSLLDAAREIELRRALLADGQVVLTGDDLHFATLLAGGAGGIAAPTGTTVIGDRTVPIGAFSHGLLGIFAGIAPPAALALQFLARSEFAPYMAIMAPCQELSRAVFAAPVGYYKSGLAFLSWLNGAQDNRMLVNHEEDARRPAYYVRVAALASRAGVITDAARAAARLEQFLREVET